MRKWHIIIGLLLLFLAGFLMGAGVMRIYIQARVAKVVGGGPDAIREHLMNNLHRVLHLDDEQTKIIDGIVLDAQMKLYALRTSFQPETEAIVSESIHRIMPCLSEPQREKLNALYRDAQSRWMARPGSKAIGTPDETSPPINK